MCLTKYSLFFIFIFYLNALLANKDYYDESYVSKLIDNGWLIKSSDPDSAIKIALKTIDLSIKMNYHKERVEAYSLLGTIYSIKGEYNKALVNYFNALHTAEAFVINKNRPSILNNIGIVYRQLHENKKALEYYNYALVLVKNDKDCDKELVSAIYSNIGNIYYANSLNSSALENYIQSLKYIDEKKNSKGLANLLNNIGNVYLRIKKYQSALNYYSEALKIKKNIKDEKGISVSLSNIGETYYQKNDFQQALLYFNKSLEIAYKINDLYMICDNYNDISKLYFSTNDFNSAYKYSLLYISAKDSLLNAEKNKQIIEIETKYQVEKQKKENLLLKKDNDLQTALLNKQRIKITFITITSGLLIISLILLYLFTRTKQREKFNKELYIQQSMGLKAINEMQEKERTRIARELHDGIGQLLAGIKLNLSYIQPDVTKFSKGHHNAYINTVKMIDEACTEVRSISHQMMPKSLTNSGLVNAIDELLTNTVKIAGIDYNFETHHIEKLPEDIEIQLYRVMQEVISNIIKHSEATEVIVQLTQNKENLVLLIEDNGIGYKPNPHNKGIGLLNITSRIHSLHGHFSIEKGAIKGTTITIRIPNKFIENS